MKNDIAAAARLAAQTTYYDAAQSAEIRELLTRLPAEIERLTAELAARAPADASGQIASLKDHLRIADSLLRGYRGAAVALTGCAEGLDDSDVIATLRAHPSAAPADAPLMRAALTSICHGDRMGLDAAALAQIARDWLDAPAADASLEARAFGPNDAAAMASDLLNESRGLAEDDPRRGARLAASLMDLYLRAVDASRPAAPSAADLRAITVDWPRTNARRGALLDREDAGTLTAEEAAELADLQRLADLLVDKMHRDANRPGLTEVPGVVFDVLDKARAFVEPFAARHNEAAHLAETTCRACRAETMIAEIEGAQEECRLVEKRRPGLAEEQVRARAWERLRTAATAAVETFEDSDCDETLEPVFEALDEALAGLATAEEESASRGETGPAAAARAKRRAQCEIDPDCALDPDHQGICDMRPPGHPAPTGLTRAMHDAAQRPSVPPRIEYEHGPDGETYRVEDDWQPCACGAAVSRGEAHPTGPGHDVDWSAVDRQRATPHAGAPASLADVVAASAREPHADVVLHALHVSGGAAAIGVESPVRDPRVDYSADMRPAVTGGECSRCLHAPPLHEATCPTLREPAVLGGHGYVSAGDRFREQLAGDRHVEAGGCKDPDCDWCDNDPDCHAPREP